MVRRMLRRGRMAIRRTKPRRRTSNVGVKGRLAKLERAVEEPHYLLWSDTGINGGANPTAAGFTGTLTTATPKALYLNAGVTRGDTVQSRTADRVHFTKLVCKMLFTAGANIVNELYVNVELIQLKVPQGDVTTVGDIFTCMYGLQEVTPALVMMNVNNRDYSKYYRRLERKTIKFSNTSNDTTERHMVSFTHFFPPGFETSYKLGNTGTYADIDTNGLYLVCYTDNTFAGTTTTGLSFTTEAILYFRG